MLFDFFETGCYDRNREFILTTSPSMDILISSNLERLIYFIANENADLNREMMSSLSKNGKYDITDSMKENLSDFVGGYAKENEVAETIADVYKKTGYVMDTHTAVAATVYRRYREENKDTTPNVIVSTASCFKFTRSVMEALVGNIEDKSDFELIDQLSEIANVAVPPAIEEIRTAEVLHDTVCDKEEMVKEVLAFLN